MGRAAKPRRPRQSKRRPLGRLVVLSAVVVGVAVLAVMLWPVSPPARTAGVLDRAVPVEPGEFAPGACEALAPTRGDNGRTVFLDAGHGGVDPGAVGTTTDGSTIYEADETLPVELDTAAQLRDQGYRVVVSRTTDGSVARLGPADLSDGVLSLKGAHDDVIARVRCADESGATLLVGIYFDSGSSPDDAGSLTTYDAVRPFSSANLRLADLLQQDVLAEMNEHGWGIPNAGVTPDSQEGSLAGSPSASPLAAAAAAYGHLLLLGPALSGYLSTPSTMPGAVIEPLFLTDPFEAHLASSREGQQVIAGGIDLAVRQYLPTGTSGSRSSTR